jgi:hypothetical protein
MGNKWDGVQLNIWGPTDVTVTSNWGAKTQAFDVWFDDFFLSLAQTALQALSAHLDVDSFALVRA